MDDERPPEGVIALGPLHWSLLKIERQWNNRVTVLESEAAGKTREVKTKHRTERRALNQRLRSARDAAKSAIPVNGRLATLKASRENLLRLGRAEEAQKVQRKLEPLEKGFWAKALAATGFAQEAKRERSKLLSAQQTELGSISLALRRDIEQALHSKYAEVKAQQRKNRCSSDDVWSIWSAAKSGESERLAYMLSLPGANVEARDPDSGWTALHFASRQGKLDAVEVLVQKQAFVGARAPDDRTPLHLAAGWGTYEVCFALLQAGADKNLKDKGGEIPQDLAAFRNRDRIFSLLVDWRPLGLTATQTQKIKNSQAEGPARPWETEVDPEIRSHLRVLDMKRAAYGDRHAGTHTTLGRLSGLCREAGRLEDAKTHLEALVKLLQGRVSEGGGERAPTRNRRSCDLALHLANRGALAVALGNLGVVCRQLGESGQASGFLEASLNAASGHKHLVDAATRNLGLHYLSEGRVDDARPLLRACLEMYEETLRSEMAGGAESVELIPPLTVLSYADMLAGDHIAAAKNSERAQSIAAKNHEYRGAIRDLLDDAGLGKTGDLSDPIPRLEWLGVQRFVAGEHYSALKFFAKARELVLLRSQRDGRSKGSAILKNGGETGCNRVVTVEDRGPFVAEKLLVPDGKARTCIEKSCASIGRDEGHAAKEFHPDAMRLDRCMAVAICRQGPEAF